MTKPNPYDIIDYPGFPFPQTHPDRMATIATLFGMNPTDVRSCRVLELGCGDGANLIPMAYGVPDSEFVGIDLADRAVAKGEAAIAELGLRNIQLRAMNALDVTADLGQFDYIIAHGLFSWVPPLVQDKILDICRELLVAHGVAYISYNTYPGGHLRQMTREMMLFHLRNEDDPGKRLSKARELIGSVSNAPNENDEYRAFLKQEFARVLERSDAALYHDDLGETNSPLYFHEFIGRARGYGLQYLAEARLAECQSNFYPTISAEMGFDHEDPLIATEQYFDFLKCRMFRQTLLCRESVPLDRKPNIDRLRKLFVASSVQPLSAKPNFVGAGVVERFGLSKGTTIAIDLPIAKVALAHLGKVWPESVYFDDLFDHARNSCVAGMTASDLDADLSGLGEAILRIYGADLINLHSYPQRLARAPGEFPNASPVARWQAQKSSTVTTLRHTTVELTDALARHLVLLLNGTKKRQALLEEIMAECERQGSLMSMSVTPEVLEKKLGELARLALLVA